MMLGALCFAGCNKEENAPVNSGREIIVNAEAGFDADTKTSMSLVGGVYKASWESGDQLALYTTNTENTTPIDSKKTLSLGTITAGVSDSFTGSIAAPASTTDYKFYAFYPLSSWYSEPSTKSVSEIRITIPSVQYPTATSFDPKADILLSEPVTQSVASAQSSVDLSLKFKRVVSVIKMTFNTFTGVESTEKISKVTITKTGDDSDYLTGRLKINLAESTLDRWSGTTPPYQIQNVSAVYSGDDAPTLSGATVFFATAPFDLASGATLTVRIETDSHYITKIISVPSAMSFAAGTVNAINLAIDGDCTVSSYTEKTIAEVNAMSGTITDPFFFKGVVVSDRSTANASTKEIYLQDNTAEYSGILVKTTSDHSYNLGDELKVILVNATIEASSAGILTVTPFTDAMITKTATENSPRAATSITAAQLKSGKYNSMYVSVSGVQAVTASRTGTVLGTKNMETVDNTFNMYVRGSVDYGPTFRAESMPTGNGTLKGLVSMYSSVYQLIPQSVSDFSGMTGSIITSFGPVSFSGTMTAGTALSGCKISIPVKNIAAATTYKVSVTPSGTGSAGITPKTNEVVTANSDNSYTLELTLAGTPTTVGDVSFAITVNTNEATPTKICDLSAEGTVEDAGTIYYNLVSAAPANWAGEYLITFTKNDGSIVNALSGQSGTVGAYTSVLTYYSTGKIESNATTDAYKCTVAASTNGFTIEIGGLYLGWTSGNTLDMTSAVTANKSEWTFSVSGTIVTITNVGDSTRKLKWNSSSPRFACYTSAQTDLTLYKL